MNHELRIQGARYEAVASQAWATVLVGVTNVIFTLLALWIIDKVGRKPLLLIGAAGMGVSLALAGWAVPSPSVPSPMKVALVLIYIAFFATGLGATVWVLISEIFPTKIRGRAMAIATMSLWVGCFIVAQSTPFLLDKLEPSLFFWIYAAMCAVMFVFVRFVVTETKGKSLEAIERMYRQG